MQLEMFQVGLRLALKPKLVPYESCEPYEPERACTCCGEFWPLDGEFWYRDAKNREGFSTQCKACLVEKEAALHARSPMPKKKVMEHLVITEGEKACTRCRERKPMTTEHYRRDASSSDGCMSRCKICLRAIDKERLEKKRVLREAAKSLLETPRPLTA